MKNPTFAVCSMLRVNSVLAASYDWRKGPLYDREAAGRHRRELRRGLRAGMWDRQRHEALMKELREGRARYDLLLSEARSRFRAETGVRFGLSPGEEEIGLLFSRYRGGG